MKQALRLLEGMAYMVMVPALFCMASHHEPEPFDLVEYDTMWHAAHRQTTAKDTVLDPLGRLPEFRLRYTRDIEADALEASSSCD